MTPTSTLKIVTFDSPEDNVPKPADAAWPGDFMEPMEVARKEDAPLWSPVSYRPGTRRANINVTLVHALVLDYDGKTGRTPDIEQVATMWAALGLEFMLHTSYSHTPEHPKLRVILPYATPVTPEQHTTTWLWAQRQALPYVIDPARKDAAGMYFVPSHPPGQAPTTMHWQGAVLTPKEVMLGVVGVGPGVTTPHPASPFAGISRPEQVRELAKLEAGCAFLRHARTDAATLPEPEWYAALSLWARCKDGDNIAQVLSSPHPGYTSEATTVKLRQAERHGPRTCADIRTLCPTVCAGCPANVTSPVLLDAPAIRPEAQLAGAKEELKVAKKYGTPDAVAEAAEKVLALEASIKAGKRRAPSAPALADPATLERLAVGERDGKPKPTKGNVALIFDYDPKYTDAFSYDLFASKLYYGGRLAEDHLDTNFAIALEYAYGIPVPTPIITEVILRTAHNHAYHPVHDYLDTLAHDGENRVERLLLDGFGVTAALPGQEAFFKRMAVKFLVSMVARVKRPGCEVHAMLVLTGAQGVGKTRGLKALAGEAWFSSTAVDIGSKDAVLQLRGKWLLELAEMDSLKKAENTRVKAWVSSATDNIRPPFGRHTVDIPRETVFAATTNQPRFLSDSTGSRRYMVARVEGQVNIAWIEANRDQIWAEALAMYESGTAWWWTFDEAIELQAFNEQYQERDPWDEVIRAGFSRLGWESTTPTQVLTVIIGKNAEHLTRFDQERVATTLVFMGCERQGDTFFVPESLRCNSISHSRVMKVLPFGEQRNTP